MDQRSDVPIPLFSSRIVDLLVPDGVGEPNSLNELRSRALMLVLLGVVVTLLGFSAIYYFLVPGAPWLWMFPLVLIPGVLATGVLHRRGGSVAVGGHGLSLLLVVSVVWFGFFTGGIFAPGTPWLIMLPLFATLFGTTRAGVGWSIAGLAVLAVMLAFHTEGILVLQMIPDDYFTAIWMGSTAALLGLVFLFFLLGRQLQRWLLRQVETRGAKLQAVLDAAPGGIFTIDREGVIQGANRGAEQMFGYGEDDLEGRRITDLIPSMGVEVDESGERDVFAPLDYRGDAEHRGNKSNGEGFPLSLSISTFGSTLDDDQAVVVVRDETRGQKMRAEMMQMDRVATVETMASGLGHEINNPLSYIKGNLDYLKRKFDRGEFDQLDEEDLMEAVEDGLHGLERIQGIVSDLRRFTHHQGSPELGAIDVEDVLLATLAVVKNDARHRAELNLDLQQVPPVLGERHGLGQVLLNLLLNATQAIPEGNADENEIEVATSRQRDEVVVTIRDTGDGIAEEHLERIFDPFFTTRDPDEGTGMGLAISQNIVEEMGGLIEVDSTVGEGTTFTLRLPVAPVAQTANSQSAVMDSVPPQLAGSSILIIDDEPKVCRALKRLLNTSFDVQFKTDASEALELIYDDPQRFDFILVDLLMPTVSGREVFRSIQQQCPRLVGRVLIITGGAFTEESRQFLEGEDVPYLQKPIEPEETFSMLQKLQSFVKQHPV